jgi:hypothetical protein
VSLWRRIILNDTPPVPRALLGQEVGEELQRCVLMALSVHATGDGHVDYHRVRTSPEYRELLQAARRLQWVDLARLESRPMRLAFWINVYNALAVHAIIALAVRRTVWEVLNFFGRISYRVGPFVLSLDEIEHGILRGNRRRVLPPWPPLRRGDPRLALAVEPLDPRVHFALTCGARSCPPIGVYHAAAIDDQLELATRNFVNQEVIVDGQGRLVCSKLFKWYRGDFGDELVRFLLRHLDDGPAKAALAAGARPCRRFAPYSWALQHPAAE